MLFKSGVDSILKNCAKNADNLFVPIYFGETCLFIQSSVKYIFYCADR